MPEPWESTLHGQAEDAAEARDRGKDTGYYWRECRECRHFQAEGTGYGACRESPPSRMIRVWTIAGMRDLVSYPILSEILPACSKFQERGSCSKTKPSE